MGQETLMWGVSVAVAVGAMVMLLSMFLTVVERMDRRKRFSRPPWIDNRVFRHVKTRRLYRLLYANVYLEAEYPNKSMCIYQSLDDNTLWVRPTSEFFEIGRFREVGEYSSLLEEALCKPNHQPPDAPTVTELSHHGMT